MDDRLYRSRDERVLVGVAGGIGEWLDFDPSLVRIAFVLLAFLGGLGLLLYVVMAFVVPEEPAMGPGASAGASAPAGAGAVDGSATAPPSATPSGPAAPVGGGAGTWAAARDARREARAARRAARRAAHGDRDRRGVLVFGAILVVVGAWFLIRPYVPAIDGNLAGPILLIAIGAVLLVGAIGRGDGSGPARPPR